MAHPLASFCSVLLLQPERVLQEGVMDTILRVLGPLGLTGDRVCGTGSLGVQSLQPIAVGTLGRG